MPATFKECEGADDDAKITPQQAPRGAVKQAAGAPAAVATADATYRGPCKRRKKRAMLSKWATAHVTVLTRGALLVFPHDPANAPKDMIGDHAIDLLANGGADVAMGPADATSAEVSISGFDVLANEAATVTLQLRTPADAENLRMCILQASRPPGTFGASNASPAPKAPAPPPPPPPSPPASIPKKPPPPPPPKRDKSATPPPPPPPKRDETAEPSESASMSAFAQAQKSAEKAKKKDAEAEEESAETAPKSPESTTAAEPAGSSEEPAVRERRYSVNTANRLLNEKEEEADKTRERLAKMYKHASAVASRVGAEVPEELAKAAVTAVAARAALTPPSASEPDGSSKPRERRYTINTANRQLEETEEEVDTSKKALVGMYRSTKEMKEKEAPGVSSEPPQTQEAEKAEESRERQPSTAAMNAAEAVWASAQEDMGIAPSPLFRSYPSPSAPSTMATPTPIAVVQEAPPASKPSPASSSQRRASVSFDPSVESASEAPIPPVAPVGGILKSSTHPHADSQEPSHGQANGRRLSVNSANARVEALESRLEMAVEKAKNVRAALSADTEQQQDHGDGRPEDADASNNQVTRARRMTVNSANARVELLEEHVAAAKIAAVQLRDKLATADTDAVEEAVRNSERAAMPPPRPEPSSRMHSESTVQAVFDAAEASVGTEQDEEAKKSSDATTGSARLDRRFSVNTANDLLAEQLERAAATEAALKETQQTLQQFLLETRKLLDERNSPGHASVAAAYTKENPSPQSEIKSAPPASPQSMALPESAFSDPASVYEEAKRMARMQRAGRAHTDSPSFTIHRPPPTPQVPSYLSPSLHSPMQQARSAMYSGSQMPMTPQPPAPQPPASKPAAPQPPVSVDEALATFAEGEAAFLSLLERSSPMSGTASQQQPPPATVGSVGDYQYPPQHSPAYYQPAPPSPGSGPPTPGSASRHYHSDLRTLSNIHHTNRSAIVASSGGDLLGEETRKLALHAVVLKPMSPYSTDTKMTSAVAMGVAPLMFRASSLKNLTSGGSSGRPPTIPSSSHSLYPHGWHTSDEYYQASARKSGGASITTEPRPVNDPYPSAGYPERMLSLGKQGKRVAGEVAAVVAGRGRGRGMYSDAYYDAEADAKSEAAQLLAASNRLTDDVHAGWGIASPAEQRADSSPGLLAEAEAEAALAAAELSKRGDRSLNTDPMSPGSFDAMNTILAKSYLPDSFDAWRAQQRRREEEQHWARYRRYQASHFPHHGA
ncbi:hypothetical protein RI054_25g105790 [Pseudoscourfieldia marina]